MSPGSRILTIDWGATSIKLGEFQSGDRSPLILHRYGIAHLPVLPDDEKLPAVLDTLKSLLTETGIRPGPTVLGISNVLVRTIQLPSEHPAEETLHHEVRQNIPFPLEEVVWSHQFTNKNCSEALIAVARRDIVEEAAAALASLDLEVGRVEAIPLALAKTFRFSHPDEQKTSLLIDIGAQTTHFVFVEGEKTFCRSVPVAGNLLTQNIGKEFQENFSTAENLKKEKASLELEEDADAASLRISRITRSFFSRLTAEINRSIEDFQKQDGAAPVQILLTGGGSLIAGTDSFLGNKLSISTHYLTSLKKVPLLPSINRVEAAKNSPFLSPMIGLARRIKEEPDLLPPSVRLARRQKARRPCLAAALILWAMTFVLPMGANVSQIAQTSAELAQYQTQLEEISSLSRQIQTTQQQFDQDRQKLQTYQRFAAQKSFWPTLFNDLNRRIPSKAWLTSLKLDADTVQMEGFVETDEKLTKDVAKFRKNLETSPVLTDIKSLQAELDLPSPKKEGKAALRFAFQASLVETEEVP